MSMNLYSTINSYLVYSMYHILILFSMFPNKRYIISTIPKIVYKIKPQKENNMCLYLQ